MPRTFAKNLQVCFTNLLYPPSSSLSSQSPIQEQTQKNNSQNPNNTSSILIKNFYSLYHDPNNYNHTSTISTSNISDDTDTTTPDFATVYKSQRFFFSSPGHSNSITESATSSLSSSSCSSSLPERDNGVVDGGVPIPTFSPDPYLDFRRSMQEMVEARDLVDVRANWEHLHELLTCYLSLNPKSTHKFIVGAFADLLVSLMKTSSVDSSCRINTGGCEKSGQNMQ